MASLLTGRNTAPLNEKQRQRATTVLMELGKGLVAFRYEERSWTRFEVKDDGEGEYGEVVFSEDVYPGEDVVHANAALSMRAAVAHELTHLRRWQNMRELRGNEFRHLDEALTSLEAAQGFAKQLTELEIQELIADACERLRLHVEELRARAQAGG